MHVQVQLYANMSNELLSRKLHVLTKLMFQEVKNRKKLAAVQKKANELRQLQRGRPICQEKGEICQENQTIGQKKRRI